MGQGAESCGGYEVEYDEYEEGLSGGYWTQRDGSRISVEAMSLQHLRNARRVAQEASRRATFTDESEKWDDWVEIFTNAIYDKERAPVKKASVPAATKSKKKVSGKCLTMRCHCSIVYQARVADLKRGWGLSCSKRCSAIRREFGRPPAKEVIS